MKALFTNLLVLLSIAASKSQDTEIVTKSVDIDNLISFIIQTYEAEDIDAKNITFLIQLKNDDMDGENLVMLKQGFKLISERLSDESKLSIATYTKYNGVALPPTDVKDLKLILHTLSDLKGSIAEFYEDGIALAYKHAEEHYDEASENSVVIIRMSEKAENEVVNIKKADKKAKKKQKRNALFITALALLPEIIDLIKD